MAPDCGMRLEPVYADDGDRECRGSRVAGLPPGTLSIPPDRQQLMGLRFANVERGSGRRTIRTVGRVAPDEGRVHRVTVGVEGWVSRVEGGASTGSFVRRGQPLAAVASRDILSPQQAYVYALESLEEVKAKAAGEQQLALVESQLAQARQGLEAIGMSGPQVRELARTRTPAPELQLASPVAGIVLARNADQGQRFERYAELFRIAALDRVWVLADVSPQDIRVPPAGHDGRGGAPGAGAPPGARERRARAVRSRARAPSRCGWRSTTGARSCGPICCSTSTSSWRFRRRWSWTATRSSTRGRRQVVFVDRGGGRLEPRPVRTGWRSRDRVEIVDGLSPGEP